MPPSLSKAGDPLKTFSQVWNGGVFGFAKTSRCKSGRASARRVTDSGDRTADRVDVELSPSLTSQDTS